ncbi:MAG: hypothetical protein P1Q69_04410 [Candidatus Thorarchaeota archaeon]|nr:hypothetical protein [Candidatus Thorarchaeota archaeon]
MRFSRNATIGIIIFLVMYFIALALLTIEVFRLYPLIDQFFVQSLLDNLAATDPIRYWLVIAIVPTFILWMFYVAFSQAPPEAKRQSFMCVLVLAIFLIVGFYAILALVYMAVTFVGIYMGGVGSGLGGYDDGKKEGRIGKIIPLIGVILGLFIELSLQGIFDTIIPTLSNLVDLPIPLPTQDASPNPSGYGLGYYITIISIMYSLLSTLRGSLGLRSDVIGSESGGMSLAFIMNPLFVVLWVLGAAVLWPLLPFVYLNWGLGLLYIMGWITGYTGVTTS